MKMRTGGRGRAAFFLLLSMGAAATAATLIYNLVDQMQRELDRPPAHEPVQVMVAAQPISQGETIGMEHLMMVDMPANYVPTGALRDPSEVVNRVPRERILAAEPIRRERLADETGGVGIPALVPKGMRAISINITGGSAMAGFLDPGNYVDVLVTYPLEEGGAETRTLLQAVTVLAVDARIGQDVRAHTDRSAPSVTLVLAPKHAEILTHAKIKGDITLALRNDIDITHRTTHGRVDDVERIGKTEQRMEIIDWENSGTGELLMIRGGDATVE